MSTSNEVRDLQFQLDACREDNLFLRKRRIELRKQVFQLIDKVTALQSELDRERDINPQDVEDLCYHGLPSGECEVRRCRLNHVQDTVNRLGKKHKWFGVREGT